MTEKQYQEFLKSGTLKKPLRGYLLDVKGVTEEGSGIIIIDDCLEELYRVCACTTIDICEHKIDGVPVDVVVDDNGLFESKLKVSAYNVDGNPELCGNLFFCNHNDEGDLTDITEEQEKAVRRSLVVKNISWNW